LFKTHGKGFNHTIGQKPGTVDKSPLPWLAYPHLWISLKEKRSKKENFIIVMASLNNNILLI
jgi:hypothetical protein